MDIAGKSLVALRDHYRHYLFEEYLPFWSQYGIDHQLGGFICALDHDGTCLEDSKNMWYQGRGLWTYSYLYQHFGGEEHLQVARKARDFLLAHGRDQAGDWVTALDRRGGSSRRLPSGATRAFSSPRDYRPTPGRPATQRPSKPPSLASGARFLFLTIPSAPQRKGISRTTILGCGY